MHSKIFQISTKPIAKENYVEPEVFYEDCSFADYIGDEVSGDWRSSYITALADTFNDLFNLNGYALVYKGSTAKFMMDWKKFLLERVNELPEDHLDGIEMYRLRRATEETHLLTSYRFYIEDWNGNAAPAEDLIAFAQSQLKKGDKLYIGAIIDYHY